MSVLHFVFDHGSTILLCVVLMWLVLKWKDAEACTKIVQMSLDLSDRWGALTAAHVERQDAFVERLFADIDKQHSEIVKLHDDLGKLRCDCGFIHEHNYRLVDEMASLSNEVYEARKALWIEQHGPPGPGDLYFEG